MLTPIKTSEFISRTHVFDILTKWRNDGRVLAVQEICKGVVGNSVIGTIESVDGGGVTIRGEGYITIDLAGAELKILMEPGKYLQDCGIDIADGEVHCVLHPGTSEP